MIERLHTFGKNRNKLNRSRNIKMVTTICETNVILFQRFSISFSKQIIRCCLRCHHDLTIWSLGIDECYTKSGWKF